METTLTSVTGKQMVESLPRQEVRTDGTYKPVQIEDIAGPAPEEPLRVPITDFLEDLDQRAAELKEEAQEVIQKKQVEEFERVQEEELENEVIGLGDATDTKEFVSVAHESENPTHTRIHTPVETKSSLFDTTDDDTDDDADFNELANISLEEESERELTDKQQEESMKMLKTKIKEKIKPFTKKVDLASMTVASTPVDLYKVIFNQKVEDTGEWALSSTGIPITIKKFPGHIIDRIQTTNGTQFNSMKQMYKLIYDQVTDANKPSFENWLKFINFRDEDDLFFAAYFATFKDSNSIPYECNACHEIFVEDIDVHDMVDFGSKENEERFKDILSKNQGVFNFETIETERAQISDDLVIDFKEASIFSAIFEPLSLKEKTRAKYADQISTIAYIENIYVIDYTANQLRPVEYKVYPDDIAKTVLSKIKTFSEFLRRLDSDQRSHLNGIINSLSLSKVEKPKYMIPKAVCPKCGKEIAQQEQTARQLLFLRHNLSAIANI